MSNAFIIDGKARAGAIRAEMKSRVANMAVKPGLAFILVGDNPASLIYVTAKEKACAEAGITSHVYRLNTHATQGEVEAQIDALNGNPSVHGILVQMPLPDHLNTDALLARVDPAKDVDGLHPANLGALFAGKPGLTPCTPQGVMILLRDVQPDLTGLHAVVIGRSVLVGRPMAQMLLQANCTVTQVHSKTRDLPALVRQADIVVAAAGVAQMVKSDWVKPGAIVIDVGMNRMTENQNVTPPLEGACVHQHASITSLPLEGGGREGEARAGGGADKSLTASLSPQPQPSPLKGEGVKSRLVGDVDFDAVKNVARAITPVPGGVGPMTIACLLANTLKAAQD